MYTTIRSQSFIINWMLNIGLQILEAVSWKQAQPPQNMFRVDKCVVQIS